MSSTHPRCKHELVLELELELELEPELELELELEVEPGVEIEPEHELQLPESPLLLQSPSWLVASKYFSPIGHRFFETVSLTVVLLEPSVPNLCSDLPPRLVSEISPSPGVTTIPAVLSLLRRL